MNDFQDTGAVGTNGNYGGPCPPVGDKPHHYVFTLYALSVDDFYAAAGIPKTGTAALHGFALNKALGDKVLGRRLFRPATAGSVRPGGRLCPVVVTKVRASQARHTQSEARVSIVHGRSLIVADGQITTEPIVLVFKFLQGIKRATL
jgi:hypothetical protein